MDIIQDEFEAFHELNPHVMHRLVQMARQAKDRGHRRIGIGMLFEVLRWESMIDTTGSHGFRLNNDLRSRYARRIMEDHPDLDGVFETRRLRA